MIEYELIVNPGVKELLVEQVNDEQLDVEYPALGVHVGVTVVLYVHVATPDDVPPVAEFQVMA